MFNTPSGKITLSGCELTVQIVEGQRSAGALEKSILIFELFTQVFIFAISIAHRKVCKVFSMDHVAAIALASPSWRSPSHENIPQPSHRQIADFVLLSQKANETLWSFSQLSFQAPWSAFLMLNPEYEDRIIRLNEHYLVKHLALATGTQTQISATQS